MECMFKKVEVLCKYICFEFFMKTRQGSAEHLLIFVKLFQMLDIPNSGQQSRSKVFISL